MRPGRDPARGHLVDVASVPDLRRLHRTEVLVGYAGAPPDLSGLDGVDGVDVGTGGTLRFTLTGPPGPALRQLALADATSLAVREPSLEEIFLDYYGEESR